MRNQEYDRCGVRACRSFAETAYHTTNQPAFALAAVDLSIQGASARTAIIESIHDTHLQVMGPNYSGRDLSEGCITSQTKSRTLQY